MLIRSKFISLLLVASLFISCLPVTAAAAAVTEDYEQLFDGPDGSQPADWKLASGSGEVASGLYVAGTSDDTLLQYAPADYPEWKNVKVTADVRLDAGPAWSGPAFRLNYSANSYYYARIQAGTAGKLEIVKVVKGVPSILASASVGTLALSRWYTIEASGYERALKAVLKDKASGRVLGYATADDNAIESSGSVGLKARFGNTAFDRVRVEELRAIPEELVWISEPFDGPNGQQPAGWTAAAGSIRLENGEYTIDSAADSLGKYDAMPYPYIGDAELSADVMLTDTGAASGPAFRINAANTGYYYTRIAYGDPGRLELVKVVGGAASVVKTEEAKISANVWYRIQTFVQGNRMKSVVTNRDHPETVLGILDATDSSLASPGSVGLKARFGNTRFDRFEAKELSEYPVNLALMDETFEGSDGTQQTGWRRLSGSFSLQSGAYAATSGEDAAAQFFPSASPRWKNVSVSAAVYLLDEMSSSGPSVRMSVSGDTYYSARIRAGTSGKLEIVRTSGGTDSVLSSARVNASPGESYIVRFVAVEDKLSAELLKGDTVIAGVRATDAAISSAGTIGLIARAGNARFDALSVTTQEVMPEIVHLDSFDGPSGWTTVVESGTGGLTVRYDPASKLYGDASMNVKPTAATPIVAGVRKTIPLPDGTKRIGLSIYTRGVPLTGMNVQIRDESGETFRYPLYNIADTAWDYKEAALEKMWDSARHSGGNNNGVPDGALTFEGVNFAVGAVTDANIFLEDLVAVTFDKPEQPETVFRVKDVDDSVRHQGSYAGFRTQYYGDNELPYLTLGTILPRIPGDYEIRFRIEKDGKIVSWGTRTASGYDPAAMEREKLTLELEEEGSYWVYVKARDGSGGLTEPINPFFVQVLRGGAPAASVDRSSEFYAAKQDHLRFNPHKPDNAYAHDEPVLLKLRFYEPSESYASLTYDYAIEDYAEGILRQSGSAQALTFEGDQPADRDIAFVPPRKGAYYMTVNLYGDGKLIDREKKLFGIRPDPYDPVFHFRDEAVTYEQLIGEKSDAYNLTGVFSFGEPHDAYFRSFVDKAADTGNALNLTVYWDQLEPLPGVYEYDYLDRRIAYAKSKGVRIVLGIWTHLDHLPQWLWYDEMLDQDYRINQYSATYLHNYTRSSPRVRQAYKSMLENVMLNYRNEAAIIGWNFSDGVESFYSDSPGTRAISDYSRYARDEFVAYLQSEFSLSDLNERYSADYAGWDEVELPRPDWEASPDLRPAWLDFLQFKQDRIKSWFDEYMSHARQYDDVRALFQYASTGTGAFEDAVRNFNAYKTIMTSGGSDHVHDQLYEAFNHKLSVALRSEPSATPPRISQVNDSFYHMAAYGGFEGLNLQFVRSWQSVSNDPAILEGIARFTAVKNAILNEGIQNSDLPGSRLGAFISYDSMIRGSKSFRWLDWGSSAAEKLYFFNDTEHFYPSWLSDYTDASWFTPQSHSVIMDTGSSMMDEDTVDLLADYAYNGGKLVLFADSGKTDLATGEASRPLLTRLGFAANGWSARGSGLAATVVPGNGAFEGLTQLMLSEQAYVEPQLTVPYTVPAVFDNGKPAAIRWSYGSGEVLLVMGTLDWPNAKGFVDALSAWGGYERVSDADSDKVRVATRSLGDERFVFAYYRPWFSTANLSQAQMDAAYPGLTANLKVFGLAAGSYEMYDALNGQTLIGRYDARHLADGVGLGFRPGELKILKLVPATE